MNNATIIYDEFPIICKFHNDDLINKINYDLYQKNLDIKDFKEIQNNYEKQMLNVAKSEIHDDIKKIYIMLMLNYQQYFKNTIENIFFDNNNAKLIIKFKSKGNQIELHYKQIFNQFPQFELINPQFKYNLNNDIKCIQINNWTGTINDLIFIFKKIFEIIDQGTVKSNTEISNIFDDFIDFMHKKTHIITIPNSKKTNTEWNIDMYSKNYQETIQTTIDFIDKILVEIISFKGNFNSTISIEFINVIINEIKKATLLEMYKHIVLYETYFTLINYLIDFYTEYILQCDDVFCINVLAEQIINPTTDFEHLIINVHNKLKIHNKTENKMVTCCDSYVTYMQKYKMGVIDFNKYKFYYYNFSGNLDRIKYELSLLNSVELHKNGSFFFKYSANNNCCIRFMITGPVDTPYAYGCFFFDMAVPLSYPNDPPNITFLNTGKTRMNPNLYNCGKVCLSILNTYFGPTPSQSEKWNSKESSLNQVILAIQALILVPDPWFNEPGYEHNRNTEYGKTQSDNYNVKIKSYVKQHAILDIINEPDKYGFSEVVLGHIHMVKKDIIENYPDIIHPLLNI